MLNRASEWFGHIAVQVAIVLAVVSFEQTSYGFDVDAFPYRAAVPRLAALPQGDPSPLGRISRAASPLLLAQNLAQNSPFPNGPSAGVLQTSMQPARAAGSSGVPRNKSAKPRTVPATSVSFGGPADPSDPYIVAQAQALNNNPAQIFAFVRDQVGFEAYAGSLRGARGALWSMAGNSLDKSSLLIALLGAVGVNAQYVEGTITTAQAQQLILSMFQTPSQVRGCIPPGTSLADPANDPTLQADVSNHFWVEFGPSNTPADPSFAFTQIGQTIGSPTQTFASIPEPLRHKVTFRLDAEEYVSADALFGLGLSTTEVVNQTFETADLVGRPVTEGNLVTSSTEGLVLSATTNTYSPYLRVSLDPSNPATDQVILGQQYQEVLTNFPLGSQVLTGLFFYMDVIDSSGNTQTFERDVLDRIGYAARNSGAAVNVSLPSGNGTAVTDLDMFTASVLPNLQDPTIIATYNTVLTGLQAQQTALAPQVAAINATSPSPADLAVAGQADTVMRTGLIVLGRIGTSSFALNSDTQNANVSQTAYVHSYFDAPRLLLFGTSISTNLNGQSTLSLALDLRSDDTQVVAPPGQAANATFNFRLTRGLLDTSLEDLVMAQLTGSNANTVVPAGAATILEAASSQGINAISITSANASAVSTLNISANAQARITNALSRGQVVLTPTSNVMVNGAPVIGWLEMDPNTGYTIGVLEDGGHQVVEAVAVLAGVIVGVAIFFLIKNVVLPNLGPGGNFGGAVAAGSVALALALAAFAALFLIGVGTLFALAAFLALILLLLLSGGAPQDVKAHGLTEHDLTDQWSVDCVRQLLLNAHSTTPSGEFAPSQVIDIGPSNFRHSRLPTGRNRQHRPRPELRGASKRAVRARRWPLYPSRVRCEHSEHRPVGRAICSRLSVRSGWIHAGAEPEHDIASRRSQRVRRILSRSHSSSSSCRDAGIRERDGDQRNQFLGYRERQRQLHGPRTANRRARRSALFGNNHPLHARHFDIANPSHRQSPHYGLAFLNHTEWRDLERPDEPHIAESRPDSFANCDAHTGGGRAPEYAYHCDHHRSGRSGDRWFKGTRRSPSAIPEGGEIRM
jgi:hypothetical protein